MDRIATTWGHDAQYKRGCALSGELGKRRLLGSGYGDHGTTEMMHTERDAICGS